MTPSSKEDARELIAREIARYFTNRRDVLDAVLAGDTELGQALLDDLSHRILKLARPTPDRTDDVGEIVERARANGIELTEVNLDPWNRLIELADKYEALQRDRDALREALLKIADGDYNAFTRNPSRWPCMIARKALGRPGQSAEYSAARALLHPENEE
jgi:AcrR family transcriptional regulator